MPQQTRTEEVKAFFQKEEKKQEEWHESAGKFQEKIDQWVGGGKPMPGVFIQPKKNHIKVLLCSLHSVLWEGNNWQIVGMDKMNDPNQVKKFYRKAMMMCHPDKINVNTVQNADKVFIANRCFAALNDAFNEYKNEPGINVWD